MHGILNSGDVIGTDNGENREYSDGSLDDAVQEIKDTLHIAVPEFYYIPSGMKYSGVVVSQETQMAVIIPLKNGSDPSQDSIFAGIYKDCL